MKLTNSLRILLTVAFLVGVLSSTIAGQKGVVVSPDAGTAEVQPNASKVASEKVVPGKEDQKLVPAPKKKLEVGKESQKPTLPDLMIRQYKFVLSNDKVLRIQVANYGQKASQSCRLQLTVRKINGTPVGREKYQTIPPIEPGKTVWILLDTKSILPKNVSLRDTTFKLFADATKTVPESNENNNETWHNQQ